MDRYRATVAAMALGLTSCGVSDSGTGGPQSREAAAASEGNYLRVTGAARAELAIDPAHRLGWATCVTKDADGVPLKIVLLTANRNDVFVTLTFTGIGEHRQYRATGSELGSNSASAQIRSENRGPILYDAKDVVLSLDPDLRGTLRGTFRGEHGEISIDSAWSCADGGGSSL